MKLSALVLLLTAGLSGPQAHAQAGNGAPRQLGGVPAPADSARRPAAASLPTELVIPAPSGPAGRFRVGLKSGTLLRGADVAAHHPLLAPPYLLVDEKRRVALAEVGFYENETGYYRRARPRGAFRELTLRRVQPGRLSVYAPRASLCQRLVLGSALLALGSPVAAATAAAFPPPGRGYFAKDDGPVYPLAHAHLSRALSDSPGAQALEARARRAEVVNTGCAALGMGLLVGGLVRGIAHLGGDNLNGELTLGMLGASVPLLVVPLVLKHKPAGYRRQAIELYNYANRP